METKDKFNRTNVRVRTAITQFSNDDNITRDAAMIPMSQTRKEAQGLKDSLANPKITRRIGTWNTRTMFSIGKTAQVIREMNRHHLDILGISECRWTGSGKTKINQEKL
jgi:hypothetical protein